METKPFRIERRDHHPIRMLALIEQRPAAAIMHDALVEYTRAHASQIAATYEAARVAFANADYDTLLQLMAEGAEADIEAAMKKQDALYD